MHTMPNPAHSPASERNREPIAAILRDVFRNVGRVLEIGSGTGQHAVYFAADFPHLAWQPSDRRENLPAIETWIFGSKLPNVLPPMELDVDMEPWPTACSHGFDAAFTANTLHIMHWPQVRRLFAGIGGLLRGGAPFVVYGPFNIGGQYTSESNREFDRFLKDRDPESGIRDLEAVTELADLCDLALEAKHPMPANNFTLVFRKR
jgi:SAM-dependent methyltransferase